MCSKSYMSLGNETMQDGTLLVTQAMLAYVCPYSVCVLLPCHRSWQNCVWLVLKGAPRWHFEQPVQTRDALCPLPRHLTRKGHSVRRCCSVSVYLCCCSSSTFSVEKHLSKSWELLSFISLPNPPPQLSNQLLSSSVFKRSRPLVWTQWPFPRLSRNTLQQQYNTLLQFCIHAEIVLDRLGRCHWVQNGELNLSCPPLMQASTFILLL